MVSDSFFTALKTEFPKLEIRLMEPMSAHTTFHIGGPARGIAFPDAEELGKVISFALSAGVKPLIIGSGSNILAPDGVLDRFVVKTRISEPNIRIDDCMVTAPAGALLSSIAASALDAGLTGFEFAAGIPGTLGGALLMNAGAYGGEIKDVAEYTDWIDETGTKRRMCGNEHDFSYRSSFFTGREAYIISGTLKLQKGNSNEIRGKMEELASKRRASQPLELPSAGSAFKRPVTGYAAAMIDQCGLRGLRVGGACVSEKHAGFIVNTGGATCADVLELSEKIQRTVFERFGTELELEIRVVN